MKIKIKNYTLFSCYTSEEEHIFDFEFVDMTKEEQYDVPIRFAHNIMFFLNSSGEIGEIEIITKPTAADGLHVGKTEHQTRRMQKVWIESNENEQGYVSIQNGCFVAWRASSTEYVQAIDCKDIVFYTEKTRLIGFVIKARYCI